MVYPRRTLTLVCCVVGMLPSRHACLPSLPLLCALLLPFVIIACQNRQPWQPWVMHGCRPRPRPPISKTNTMLRRNHCRGGGGGESAGAPFTICTESASEAFSNDCIKKNKINSCAMTTWMFIQRPAGCRPAQMARSRRCSLIVRAQLGARPALVKQDGSKIIFEKVRPEQLRMHGWN